MSYYLTMAALITFPLIHLLYPSPPRLFLLLLLHFFFPPSASSACLSVSEACDWTAETLISIMLWHPSSTCVQIRKISCVCVRVCICVCISDFPVMCGASAAVTSKNRVQQSTKRIKHVSKCLISKQTFGGNRGRTLYRRVKLDSTRTFFVLLP